MTTKREVQTDVRRLPTDDHGCVAHPLPAPWIYHKSECAALVLATPWSLHATTAATMISLRRLDDTTYRMRPWTRYGPFSTRQCEFSSSDKMGPFRVSGLSRAICCRNGGGIGDAQVFKQNDITTGSLPDSFSQRRHLQPPGTLCPAALDRSLRRTKIQNAGDTPLLLQRIRHVRKLRVVAHVLSARGRAAVLCRFEALRLVVLAVHQDELAL
jgi:hypothetical protein